MGSMQLVISGMITLIVYSMVLFAVYKVFQISNDVTQMKEYLRAIKDNTGNLPAPAPPSLAMQSPQSAEALVRAVHESYKSVVE